MFRLKKTKTGGSQWAVVLIFLLHGILSLHAQELPEAPNQLVSDYAGVLSSTDKQRLEQKLLAYEDSTSTQIAVVLVNTTDGYEVGDYAVRLAKKWGVTIQTGYGMEGVLPDIITYRIIQNEIKPSFQRENYYQGLDNATNAIIAYAKGEYKADPREQSGKGGGVPIILIVIIVIVVISIVSKGGGGNGGGKVMTGRGSSNLFWWTLLNGMGRGGRGGGFGGGGGGFGGGGGGFGGFGGGGFGGGGSSGSW